MNFAPLDLDEILAQTFVRVAEFHEITTSTNDLAKQWAQQGDTWLPRLIVARQQTAGRGRGTNRWWTGAESLAFSLLLDGKQIGIARQQSPLVALAAAMAVLESVAPLLGGITVGIHWPNDVFADGRKLAGVLVEVMPGGHYVLGVGINTNDTVADAPAEIRPRVTTLRDLTGITHDPTTLMRAILGRLAARLESLASAPAEVAEAANAVCLQRGWQLALVQGEKEIAGRCRGIAEDGALVLETDAGVRRIYSGVIPPASSS